ncbi:30S ribosomal protein S15 [Mycoplasma suis]|uniref:30S ribosomal protein S15 n=2 Tax=Mycoplasma suis TaxID=57372 RepID=F0QQR5_MYCSL|nr:30S ribosomal protein S15 [Mycoplasma suis]ADX97835.1 30S ribosomal protein S15 [Mycoplasma suis str. Illinois]CBZ40334.1 30S ribosomal protein S15 [Mycoplasma suis KI3806]
MENNNQEGNKPVVNCGDSVFQLRIIWKRIQNLQKHLKVHKKDYYCKTSLFKLLSQRKKLLKYLKRKFPEKYQLIINEQK